jgi:predicted RNase H-like HicB family nuclease
MEKYLVVIEKAKNNYSAFSPDVLGCIATGSSVEDVTTNMKEALLFHIENMKDVPHAMGISKHIADGVFNKDQIADEYFITEIDLQLIPQHA